MNVQRVLVSLEYPELTAVVDGLDFLVDNTIWSYGESFNHDALTRFRDRLRSIREQA